MKTNSHVRSKKNKKEVVHTGQSSPSSAGPRYTFEPHNIHENTHTCMQIYTRTQKATSVLPGSVTGQ